MRYVIYTILVAIGLMLFLPASGGTQIRNLARPFLSFRPPFSKGGAVEGA